MNYALVTGASKGIGRAIAVDLARRQHDLILVARSGDLLEALAKELIETYNVKVQTKALDLTNHDSTTELFNWVKSEGLAVDVLVNNAGFGIWGQFTELELDAIHGMNLLNIDALVRLTHHFLPELLRHSRSYLLNVSSLGGYTPLAYKANYGASKAYVTAFTRAIREEHRDDPINICALCPGGVRTAYTRRAGMAKVAAKTDHLQMNPDQCARIALDGLFRNQAEIIPGGMNWLGHFLSRFMSKSVPIRMARKIFDPFN